MINDSNNTYQQIQHQLVIIQCYVCKVIAVSSYHHNELDRICYHVNVKRIHFINYYFILLIIQINELELK